MTRIAITGLTLLWLCGCVIMDSTLTLEHTPAMDAVAARAHPVFLARVTDRRNDPDRIGCKKSGLGTESASLYLDVGLTDWFGGVMNDELRRAGLLLTGPQSTAANRIEVDLLDFFIEPKTSFMSSYKVFAIVNAEVIVHLPDGSVFARRFTSHFSDTSMVPTDGSYEEAMQEAMTAWIGRVVPHIIQLLDGRGQVQARAGAWSRRRRARL